jgi:hypothetical protein
VACCRQGTGDGPLQIAEHPLARAARRAESVR